MPIPWNREKYYENEIIAKYDFALKTICEKNNLPHTYMADLLNKNI